MTDDERIKNKLIEMMVEKGHINLFPNETVLETSTLEDDLGMDSLEKLNLFLECEKEFKITLDEDKWSKDIYENTKSSIGDVVKCISSKNPVFN